MEKTENEGMVRHTEGLILLISKDFENAGIPLNKKAIVIQVRDMQYKLGYLPLERSQVDEIYSRLVEQGKIKEE